MSQYPENFPQVVTAMDRLNSFARSPVSRLFFNLFETIYRMKPVVIAAADGYGLVMARNIFVMSECRSCGGDGIHKRYRYGYAGSELYGQSDCWNCSATGKTRLNFREFRVGRTLKSCDWNLPDLIWHSPANRLGGPYNYGTAEESTDWKPRQPGKVLASEEVATALNILEPRFSPTGSAGWSEYQRYTFSIGGTIGKCAFCSSPENLSLISSHRGRLSFHRDVCSACQKHYHEMEKRYEYRMGGLVADRLPIPEELITPEIGRWINRHGGMKKVTEVTPVPF